MAEIPLRFLVHTVDVDPYVGSTGLGDKYADTVADVPCLRDDQRKLVRATDNTEVVSETTLIMRRQWKSSFLVGSRVDLGDRTATVLVAKDRSDGGLGAWQHLEVSLDAGASR